MEIFVRPNFIKFIPFLIAVISALSCGGGDNSQPKLAVTLMLDPSPTANITAGDSVVFVANVKVDTLGMNLYSDSRFGIQWSSTGGILSPVAGQDIAWRNYMAPGTPGNYEVKLASTYDTSKSLTTTITVIPRPIISTFSAGSLTISYGNSTTLTTTFTGGTGSIEPGIGVIASGVPVTISPDIRTTYSLSVTNALGKKVTQNIEVKVIGGGDPSISGFTATPDQIKPGQSAMLHATYGDNGMASIAPSIGGIGSSGDVLISTGPLFATTAFTLSVATHTRTDLAPAIVEVVPGLFTATGSMVQDREYFNPVVLSDGRVLAAGGQGNNPPGPEGNPAVDTAEIYSAATGVFTPTGRLAVARYGATVTLLTNGKVLLLGGFNFLAPHTSGQALDSGEIYDPSTGQFTLLSNRMARPRGMADAVRLKDGKVLIVGGSTQGVGTGAPSAEVFDPTTNTFQATTNDPQGDPSCIFQQLVLLDDGRVLVFGRSLGADIFDPSTLSFTPTGNPVRPRDAATSRLLANGKVLTFGGSGLGSYQSAEIFDPASGVFMLLDNALFCQRFRAGAAFLPDGKLLIVGGPSQLSGSEIFDPSTLTFTLSGRPHNSRWGADLVTLPTGKILGFTGMKNTEIYE